MAGEEPRRIVVEASAVLAAYLPGRLPGGWLQV